MRHFIAVAMLVAGLPVSGCIYAPPVWDIGGRVPVMTGGSSAQISQAMFLGPRISITRSKKMGNLLQRDQTKKIWFL